jgi:hypothetical protein
MSNAKDKLDYIKQELATTRLDQRDQYLAVGTWPPKQPVFGAWK